VLDVTSSGGQLNRKALVTGGSGFIGSHFVEALINRGYEVFCLVRKTSNTDWIRNQKVTFIRGDYFDKPSLTRAVKGMDYVFHLGAVLNASDWETYYSANVLSTKHLIEVCFDVNPGIKRFIFVSSISASGPSKNYVPKKEYDECQPVSMYGKSKFLAEKIVNEYRDKLPIVIVRPVNVLGVRQKQLYYVLKLIKKRIPPLWFNKDKKLCLCFVQDLVKALILVAENDQACGEIYFVANNHFYTWWELIQTVAKILNVKLLPLRVPFPVLYSAVWILECFYKMIRTSPPITRQKIAISRYTWLCDSQKIQRELGFKTEIGFEEGIRDIIRQYQKEGLL